MPFLGQDWRSPGWSWIKTEDGWKRCESWSRDLERENNPRALTHSVILNSDDEEIFSNEEQEYTSKKRKKDHFRNDTNAQCFYREKWIYVHKESTRERHGYCTLGEAFNRLDFSSAIQDIRRFTYVVKLLQLIARSQLTSLSGAAQKNYFSVLDKIVQKVLDDHQNPRLIKDLLQDLSSTLCILLRGVGKSVLVGNINIWVCRLETVLRWQQQLQDLQVTKVNDGLTLSDLPLHMLNNILYRFSDGWDIVTLGQVTPTLSMLSEDRRLWKKLCQYHFAEKQAPDRVGEGPRGVEADVLRAAEALPAAGAVRGHAALLPPLQHPLLEGLGAPLHRRRPRQLLHARVPTALHRPVQVLKAEGVFRAVLSPGSYRSLENAPPPPPPPAWTGHRALVCSEGGSGIPSKIISLSLKSSSFKSVKVCNVVYLLLWLSKVLG
ncbi:F-box only protein 25 isoform X2 [Mustela lutreola]|uniref:F-box only protein 25 isoform X2 n=1 Tax=Mustela lutreola TaxID=9666 RepID=UPI002797961E|nr:F-box only protein 25 isoform X2 [Mustela lutreola]